MPKAPSRYNPIVNKERALERRKYVLDRMFKLEKISQEDYDIAIAEEDMAKVHGQDIDVEPGNMIGQEEEWPSRARRAGNRNPHAHGP